jgi:hypothetical protein
MSSLLIVLVFLGFARRTICDRALRPDTRLSARARRCDDCVVPVVARANRINRHTTTGRASPTWHRGCFIAAVIVVLNPLVVAWSVPHLLAENMSTQLTALIVVADLLFIGIFLVLVGLAIRWRRYPEDTQPHAPARIARGVGACARSVLTRSRGTPLLGIIGLMVLPLVVVVHDS